MDKLFFIDKDTIGILEKNQVETLESQYLIKYRKNALDIIKKHEWKTQGINAAFRQETRHDPDPDSIRGKINGITLIDSGTSLLYSVSIESFSGLFIKSLGDTNAPEVHIMHGNKVAFYGIDAHEETGEIILSVNETPFERNLALLDKENNRYRLVTEGETQDDNPIWSKTQKRTVFYESAGVGRDYQGNFVGLGPKTINKLDLNRCTVDEVVALPGYDCFRPQVDGHNNLYFIKKPYQAVGKQPMTIVDVIAIPFKILKAIARAIEFFTVKHTGESFTSKGFNPAKTKTLDPKEIIINGNIINAEKTYQQNKQSGQPYPGIAPKNWELMCLDSSGNMRCIKQGVIGYTLNKKGEIIYSNGKYIIKITNDGKEEVLQQIDYIDGLITANY